jgi:hypothetical protein
MKYQSHSLREPIIIPIIPIMDYDNPLRGSWQRPVEAVQNSLTSSCITRGMFMMRISESDRSNTVKVESCSFLKERVRLYNQTVFKEENTSLADWDSICDINAV